MPIKVQAFAKKIHSFVESTRGTAALEFAICFPLFIVIFFQYIGLSHNIHLIADLERATASLGDVIANTKLKSNPSVSSDDFVYSVMKAGVISNTAIQNAFQEMVGASGIDGNVRIDYSASKSAAIETKSVQINNGGCSFITNGAELIGEARSATADYTGRLIGIEACIKNIAKDDTLLTKYVFPSQYCSTFVAPRRE